MALNKVKGTYDVLPTESKKWQALEAIIHQLLKDYNYQEIRTPIFEYSQVFHRDSEQSDMVTKETYNFLDRSDRQLTLRPEGTAGSIRAYVENKLYANSDLTKMYYLGPNFRYERPQSGRFRQFYQFGIEAIGATNPLIDAEVITLSFDLIKRLGLKGVKVRVNSLGDEESKINFRKALVKYFTPIKDKLCADCQKRLVTNPLRILDCKVDHKLKEFINCPIPTDYLSEKSSKHFAAVCATLTASKIPYVLSPKLVRGLDYYSETVFEIEADIEGFGAQNVLGGGGRYEGLVAEMGGPTTGAIGVAFGMERIILALEKEGVKFYEPDGLDVYLLVFDQKDMVYSMQLAHQLRSQQISVDLCFTQKSFKSQLKTALNLKSKYIVMIGEEEVKTNILTVKETDTQQQEHVPASILARHIKEKLK